MFHGKHYGINKGLLFPACTGLNPPSEEVRYNLFAIFHNDQYNTSLSRVRHEFIYPECEK